MLSGVDECNGIRNGFARFRFPASKTGPKYGRNSGGQGSVTGCVQLTPYSRGGQGSRSDSMRLILSSSYWQACSAQECFLQLVRATDIEFTSLSMYAHRCSNDDLAKRLLMQERFQGRGFAKHKYSPPLLANEDGAFGTALVEGDGRLIHVQAKGLLQGRRPADGVVPPPPRSEGLFALGTLPGQKAVCVAPESGHDFVAGFRP